MSALAAFLLALLAAVSAVMGWPIGEPCAWAAVAALVAHYWTRPETWGAPA